MQSRKHSLLESSLNTLSGFLITLIAQSLIYPAFSIHTTGAQNFQLALIFTALSIVRSYVWRRLFNRLTRP